MRQVECREQRRARVGLPLIEGDEFHSKENQEKMHNGIALTDADRKGWLEALGEQLAAHPLASC
jgi:gluconokinase